MHQFYKKYISVIFAIAFWTFAPLAIKASTISLNPDRISVQVGESFSIAIKINAAGENVYTAKMNMAFTPGILNLSTWSFNDAWLAIRQNGYDSFDNAKGTLLRTGGYPSGFSNAVLFGNAKFKAQKAGQGSISINANTFVYNELNKNTYTGANKVIVEVLPVTTNENNINMETLTPVPTELPKTSPALFDIEASPGSSTTTTGGKYFNIAAITLLVSIIIIYFIKRRHTQKKGGKV